MKIEQVESWDVSLTNKELAKLLGFNGEVMDVVQNEDTIVVVIDGEKIKQKKKM